MKKRATNCYYYHYHYHYSLEQRIIFLLREKERGEKRAQISNIEMNCNKKVGPEEFFLFPFLFFLFYVQERRTFFFAILSQRTHFCSSSYPYALTPSFFLSRNPNYKRKLNKPFSNFTLSFFFIHLIPFKPRTTTPFSLLLDLLSWYTFSFSLSVFFPCLISYCIFWAFY